MSGEQKVRSFNQNLDIQMHENNDGESKWTEIWNFVVEYFDLERKKEEFLKYVQENPMKSIFFFVTLAMCSIPVMCFLVFVVGSIFFTVMGFLIFEGSILAVGFFVLISVILVAGSFGAGISILLIGCFKGAQMSNGVVGQARNLVMSLPCVRNIVRNNKADEKAD